MQKTEKFVKLCNWLQNATAWTKIKVWWRPVVPQKNAKKWRKFWNFTIGCRVPQHKQKSKFDQDQTSSSWEKCKKLKKFVKLCNWLQNATAWTKINVWWRPVVLQKNAKKWENFETLQLAAECHSINKNQSLIKIRPVVPEKNAKKWRKFWNFAIGCRVPQHKQKSKIWSRSNQ